MASDDERKPWSFSKGFWITVMVMPIRSWCRAVVMKEGCYMSVPAPSVASDPGLALRAQAAPG